MFELLDLHFLGEEQLFCTYLLDLDDGLALVDPGPQTTLAALESGLAELDVTVGELRHLLITHIHFDHAGACGALVAANPRLRVHVSGLGAAHLANPERLERSVARLEAAGATVAGVVLNRVRRGNYTPYGTYGTYRAVPEGNGSKPLAKVLRSVKWS